MLAQAAEFDPARVNEIDMQLRQLPAAAVRRADDGPVRLAASAAATTAATSKTGTFALHTLKDDETIARWPPASSASRCPTSSTGSRSTSASPTAARATSANRPAICSPASSRIAGSTSRRPRPGRRPSRSTAPGNNGFRQKRLDQIVGNWGRFEPGQVQPAGKNAAVDFRFRNGKKVSFEAHAIKVAKLLDDVKAYLKSNPGQLDWNAVNIGNIGYRLVEQNQQQYLGDKVAAWDLDLKPRPAHVDDRITVTTPLQEAGRLPASRRTMARRQHQPHHRLGHRHGHRQEAARRPDVLLRRRRRHRRSRSPRPTSSSSAGSSST